VEVKNEKWNILIRKRYSGGNGIKTWIVGSKGASEFIDIFYKT
jgi:hypothetical protein